MKCFLSEKCKKLHCDDPNGCMIKFKFEHLYDAALLPEALRYPTSLYPDADGTDLNEFRRLKEIQNNIQDFIESGENLYIYSNNTGNGKTSWTVKLLQTYISKIWFNSALECRALYISVPKLLNNIKNSISANPDSDCVEYIKHVKANIEKCDLVVWDDIATKTTTSFENDQLFAMIDNRMAAKKCNLFSSNLNEQELHKAVGDRLSSRIFNNSITIQLHGADKRGLHIDKGEN